METNSHLILNQGSKAIQRKFKACLKMVMVNLDSHMRKTINLDRSGWPDGSQQHHKPWRKERARKWPQIKE